MPNTHIQNNKRDESVSQGELVELILEPLSSLIDQARLEILEKIQDVDDLIAILARQVRREMDE